MNLARQLHQALDERRYDDALDAAQKIEASDYPLSIKNYALQILQKIGRIQVERINQYTESLYQAVTLNQQPGREEVPSWLPWRIILDCLAQGNSHGQPQIALPEKALEIHTETYLRTGNGTLGYLDNIGQDTITMSIADYFDSNYYRECHLDMRGASQAEALAHYAIHGGSEDNRKPNRLFSNQDLFRLYPWVKNLRINALYLIVRWPEEFTEIRNLITKRYIAQNKQLNLPWTREDALFIGRSESTSSCEYERILAITKEISCDKRLILPRLRQLNIHFVIPDFTNGSGGHMTIFRLIMHLEKHGHKCTVWIKDYQDIRHPRGPRLSAITDYQSITARVLPLSAHFAFSHGDALIATSWDTVEIVSAHSSFHDHFYLVQDYEPYFYPRGSESLEAERTYCKNIKTICASSWLDGIMRGRFGRTSTYFNLSYNSSIYYCSDSDGSASTLFHNADLPQNSPLSPLRNAPCIRIAFYARSRTHRRAVSLALKGIKQLKQHNYTIILELFGDQSGIVKLPDNVIGYDNGILKPEQLAKLYRSCDIGLTFSATNHALVPQEMMACRLPVIELDNDSTRSIYPEGTLVLAEPSAQGIADAIDYLAIDQNKLQEIATNGLKWVQKGSWDLSFQKVESFIRDQVALECCGRKLPASVTERYLNLDRQVLQRSTIKGSIVSVVIPVYQGGSLLQEVLTKVQSQLLESPFEIVLIDSSSSDGIIEKYLGTPSISIYRIPKKSFQHGRTRNLGVSLAQAPFVAFLTQDSIPVDDSWLANLIKPLQDCEDVACVFGKHIAHPRHPNYVDRWIKECFERFKARSLYSKSDFLNQYYQEDPSCRQFLHYYSDNNSCLRKSQWEEYPYHDVFFGEDQLWADWIIQADSVKAYANEACVYHSHDYTEEEEYERARTEAYFFAKYFGYSLGGSRFDIETGLQEEARSILSKGMEVDDAERVSLLKLLRSKREGHKDGCFAFRKWLENS